MIRWLFGAHGQVAVGAVFCVGSIATWVYGTTLHGAALIRLIFHVSMAALAFAAYGIVATGLGYRASERIEEVVTEQVSVDAENVEVETHDRT